MKLKLTYRRSSGLLTDVVVTTDATASVGDIARELIDADPLPIERGRFGPAVTLSVSPPGGGPQVMLPHDRVIGDAAIASGCQVSVVEATETAIRTDVRAAAVLRVVEGPDAGREFSLPPGPAVIGRDASADVMLNDPFVSKRHARIDVGTTIELVDLNSANGIGLDGGVVTRLKVLPEQVIVLGDSHLTITSITTSDTAPVHDITGGIAGGAVGFNRSPRVEARYPDREHPRPVVPTEAERQPFAWLLLLPPVVMGVGLYLLTRNPMSLMFIAMAPMMMFGNHVTSRGRTKRQLETDIAKFEKQLEVLEQTLRAEIPQEQATRQAEAPPVADIYQGGLERRPLLWTRRPEHWSFLHVRLGTATLPSRNSVASAGATDDGLPEYTQRLEELESAHRMIADVPVLEDLLLTGALGVVGGVSTVSDAVRGLLVQLAGLHSPAELVITAMVSPNEVDQHTWLAWLPHTSSPQSPIVGTHLADSPATIAPLVAQLEELVDQRLGHTAQDGPEPMGPLSSRLRASSTGGQIGVGDTASDAPPTAPRPVIVVLVTDAAPADRARLVQLSERAAAAGVLPIWVAGSTEQLPAVCRTFVDVSSGLEAAEAHFVRHGTVVTPVHVEGVSAEHADRFAMALAPLSDTGALVADASDLPHNVPIVTLLGDELVGSSSAVVDRWQQNHSIHVRGSKPVPRSRPGTLRALVGQSGADATHLDLRTQGPHALVGGTTGSGKSEFLQAWVLGMAAEFSPDRVTFLFVDYKGGAAFADCVRLPHCVGLVTDLSTHLVRRALTSLRAELRHREHLLNLKKAKDLLELEKRGDPESPPALILVIDEFAALATEVPEFVEGVVDIAQRGRSLGIHLIMATQRPAGVIKDNLRANTNLRVALRMADESDSADVIGTPEAAALDPSIPGRGVIKTGPGRLMAFQSAYAGGRTSAGAAQPTIVIHPLGFGADHPWERPDDSAVDLGDDAGPTDQQRLVSSIDRAALLAEIPAPRRPWLDELSKSYDLSILGPRTDTELVLGVTDLPEGQRQEVAYFRPDVDGNLAVYGTGGSGKSVLLRTLAASAGVTPRGGPVDVYCLDFAAGGLRMLDALPHVGAVIPGDDTERVVRLLRTLRETAERRARAYPAVNAGTISEYRELAGKPDEPRILLLIDGFASFRDQWEVGGGRAPWYGVFQTLLSEGRQLGIHVAFTADRPASVPGAVASSVPRRVVLRLAEDTMYTSLDVRGDVLSGKSPPGRAIVDDEETQIAILGGSGNVADQSQALAKLARAITRQGRLPAPPIESLPTNVALDSLPARVGDLPLLGISDDTLAPVGFEPTGTFLVGGGPQSGRSNALVSLVRSLRRWDPSVYLVYLGHRRSTLPSMIDWDITATTPQEIVDVAKELTAKIPDVTEDKYVVVIEAMSEHASNPTDIAIVDLIRAVKRSDHLVIAESESSTWPSSYPIFTEVKVGRRGILLQPETMEGDTILRTSFPRASRAEFPPGRGVAVQGGKAVRVQLPLA